MTLVDRSEARGTATAAGAWSAVAVGTFGWLLAHVVTFWLVAHRHAGMLETAGHVHSGTAVSAAIVGVLATASLTAIVFRARRTGIPAPEATGGASVTRLVGLSILAFLAADAAEHAVLGWERTPPALLLFGALLHAIFGAGGSLCCLRLSSTVRILLAWLRPLLAPNARRTIGAGEATLRRRLLWADAVAGRAPPVG